MKKIIDNALRHRFLLAELVKRGIRLKYRRSYLGILWSLIEPLLTTAVLVVVFTALLDKTEKGGNTFPLYIICGRLLYSFFSAGTKGAASSVRKNAQMIKKVYVPKYLYPLSQVLYNFIIFLISLLALVAVMIVTRVAPSWEYIWQVIPALVLLLLITLGVGMILATLMVFFRDIQYMWNVFLMIIMYLCAIFYYPTKLLKTGWAWLLNYNPLYCVIDIFRGGLIGYTASLWDYAYASLFAVVALAIGLLLFRFKQDEFILHL